MDQSTSDLFASAMAVNGLARGNEVRYDPPRARASDPATSHEAAASVKESAAIQREMIVNLIRRRGPLTNDEIDEAFAWREGTASRRTIELYRHGDLQRDPRTVRETRTGRKAMVNILAPARASV